MLTRTVDLYCNYIDYPATDVLFNLYHRVIMDRNGAVAAFWSFESRGSPNKELGMDILATTKCGGIFSSVPDVNEIQHTCWYRNQCNSIGYATELLSTERRHWRPEALSVTLNPWTVSEHLDMTGIHLRGVERGTWNVGGS